VSPNRNGHANQGELFAHALKPRCQSFRLQVNDCVRIDGRVGLVIRVTECAAVVLVNRPAREFITRFDQRVRFQPSPALVRISSNAEIEILNRKGSKVREHRQPERRIG
jgi:hypothetical protein